MEKQVIAGPMLMPKYVGRFACSGGDCQDTCCSGWRIDLDRATLLQYQSCDDAELGPLFRAHVKRNPTDPTFQVFGHLQKLNGPCHYCPFLDAAGLCRIHSRMGAEWLCDTCADFPRTTVEFGDYQQMTLQLSCPEAARLALLEPDAFDLGAGEGSCRAGGVGRVAPVAGLTLADMEEIRTQLFQILLTQEVELPRRLAVLGLFCQRLTELIQQGRCDHLAGLTETMDECLRSGALQVPLNPETERRDARLEFGWIFVLSMRVSELPPHQRRVIDAVATGLGIRADGSLEPTVFPAGYRAGAARLEAALEAVPGFLERYLLNEALREVFPWSKETPYEHYIHFLLRFAILQVMLAGRAAAQETLLTPEELAETVQVFCRRMQNGQKITDQINPDLTKGDWSRLQTLFTVV